MPKKIKTTITSVTKRTDGSHDVTLEDGRLMTISNFDGELTVGREVYFTPAQEERLEDVATTKARIAELVSGMEPLTLTIKADLDIWSNGKVMGSEPTSDGYNPGPIR